MTLPDTFEAKVENDPASGGTAEDVLVFPPSFAQQRLWFIHRLQPDNTGYNVPGAMRLSGELNVAALEQSIREIRRRHESLRTTFAMVDDQAAQLVSEDASFSLPVMDLTAVPKDEQDAKAKSLATEEAQRPFDLERGPLLRATLLRFGETEHVLLLNMHHIVSDGWSMSIFTKELRTLYDAFQAGRPSPLSELPIQYADFAVWQREVLQGDTLDTQLAYWLTQLADIVPLQLPTDKPRPAVQTFRGGKQRFSISKKVYYDLKAIAQRESCSLFMVLLAVFAVLLRRYSGQSDFVIGSPIANRNRSELEEMIGFFVNSLALRLDCSGDPTFVALLRRVREVTLGAYDHQDIPFERLVEELQPERDLSQNPIFQVAFTLQNAPRETLQMPGLALSRQEFDTGTTRFDLEFHLWDLDKALAGVFYYNLDLFRPETAQRMAGHYESLLAAVAAHPERSIHGLSLLTPKEKEQFDGWNDTSVDFPTERCVHELFAEHAGRAPNAVAIADHDASLSYGELNAQANRLAHYLKRRGIAPDVPVAVLMHRSCDMIVALLGVLKAGGCYVPIDPTYPPDRIALILHDVAAPVLITTDVLREAVLNMIPNAPSDAAAPPASPIVICVDAEERVIAAESITAPTVDVRVENLAYIIYTSGSTGQPKGVEVEHRSLCNLIAWHNGTYEVTPADRATHLAGVGFDASVWELWPYLAAGASLHIPPDDTRLEIDRLLAWMASEGITLSFIPTPIAAGLTDAKMPPDLALRAVLTGGDRLQSAPRQSLPFRFVNHYGPTESTVVATAGDVQRAPNGAVSSPPIGKPIANTRTYILDGQLNRVPVGVPGELYVGGNGLARGYLNSPALTAERFVVSPFAGSGNDRLYKTGDLARFLPDGNIEFLGRNDDQVKIRGNRVELGEIESILAEHTSVERCAVTVHTPNDGATQIVAYVVPRAGKRDANDADAALAGEHVDQWKSLYEDTYRQPATQDDPTFNITGWNSSYTGEPLQAAQMREWVDRTVERIHGFGAKRVLEIGCGTGLLLLRLAPQCTQYVGTDFSHTAIDYVDQQVRAKGFDHVSLMQRPADDFSEWAKESFDVIVLNSVVQYFPGIDYLRTVLQGAARLVKPGGMIFVGDVRSLPLLGVFHASVQMSQASQSLIADELRQRVHLHESLEQELTIDPAFFVELAQHDDRITHVQVELKRGKAHNELTKYRYDATLHIEATAKALIPERWLDWQRASLSIEVVRHMLETDKPELLALSRVPNARLAQDLAVWETLASAEDAAPVAALRSALDDRVEQVAVDPSALWSLGDRLGYTAHVSWSDSGANGRYDVVLVRREQGASSDTIIQTPLTMTASKQLANYVYANDPLQAKITRRLAPILREHLQAKLPEYMVPSSFVMLASMPLSPNGKVDRKALPAPGLTRSDAAVAYAAPTTETEEKLARLWAELLSVDRVGLHDNFFELGGHSLLATQVVSRMREAFGLSLELRALFEAPTVAGLAACVDALRCVPDGISATTESEGEEREGGVI